MPVFNLEKSLSGRLEERMDVKAHSALTRPSAAPYRLAQGLTPLLAVIETVMEIAALVLMLPVTIVFGCCFEKVRNFNMILLKALAGSAFAIIAPYKQAIASCLSTQKRDSQHSDVRLETPDHHPEHKRTADSSPEPVLAELSSLGSESRPARPPVVVTIKPSGTKMDLYQLGDRTIGLEGYSGRLIWDSEKGILKDHWTKTEVWRYMSRDYYPKSAAQLSRPYWYNRTDKKTVWSLDSFTE